MYPTCMLRYLSPRRERRSDPSPEPPGCPTLPPEMMDEIRTRMDFEALHGLLGIDIESTREARRLTKARVGNQFTRFNLPMDPMLDAMDDFQAFIGGSFALAALFPDAPFEHNEMDIYVESYYLWDMHHWLLDNTDYVPGGNDLVVEYDEDVPRYLFQAGYGDNVEANEPVVHPSTNKVINILSFSHGHAFLSMLDLLSTHHMNVIMPWGVGCAYPRLTLSKVGVLRPTEGRFSSPVRKLVREWEALGFKIASSWSDQDVRTILEDHSCATDMCCPAKPRDLQRGSGFLWIRFEGCQGRDVGEEMPCVTWATGFDGFDGEEGSESDNESY